MQDSVYENGAYRCYLEAENDSVRWSFSFLRDPENHVLETGLSQTRWGAEHACDHAVSAHRSTWTPMDETGSVLVSSYEYGMHLHAQRIGPDRYVASFESLYRGVKFMGTLNECRAWGDKHVARGNPRTYMPVRADEYESRLDPF